MVMRSLAVRCMLLLAAGGPGLQLVYAQDRPAPRPSDRPQRPLDAQSRPQRPRPPASLNDALPPLPGPNPFRPRPGDAGPLAPQEDRELLDFAQAHMPRLYERLNNFRQRDPSVFPRRIAEAAPRLRMLQRLFRDHPQLAPRVVAHIEKTELLRRAERLWADAGDNRTRKQRIENEARRILADLTEIEQELAAGRAREIEQNREQMVETEVARLTARDADLAGEPRELRFFVDAYNSAEDETSRAATRADLNDLVWVALDEQLEVLRQRADMLEKNRRQIVDRRFNAFAERASGERTGPPNAGVPTSRP
jgi:hypothetical protein